MAKSTPMRYANKDDPIYTGRFVISSLRKSQSSKDTNSPKPQGKKEDE